MSAASVLARGRSAAEARMLDSCTIRRQTGQTTDPETGVTTPTYATVYSGKCEVQQSDVQSRPETAGEAYLLMNRRELKVPMSVTGLKVSDEVTIDSSVYDPDLTGSVFLLRDLFGKSFATARRIQMELQTS